MAVLAIAAPQTCALAVSPTSCVVVEIASLAGAGTDATRSFPGPKGEQVVVSRESIVTSRDGITADMSFAEGVWGLGLHFSPKTSARMQAFTAAHVGDQLAFIVQGRAKMVVKILDPNMGDGAWISPFDRREGDELAARINACPKPLR